MPTYKTRKEKKEELETKKLKKKLKNLSRNQLTDLALNAIDKEKKRETKNKPQSLNQDTSRRSERAKA